MACPFPRKAQKANDMSVIITLLFFMYFVILTVTNGKG